MRKPRKYNKVTDMRKIKDRPVFVNLQNIQIDKEWRVIRNNKYITKDGNVRNFSDFRNDSN